MAPPGFPSDIESIETAIRQVPIMFMDSWLRDGLSYVGTNNRQSVAIMVDYLCRSGDPPALFTMPAVNANVFERRAACSERMLELGHEPRILNPEDGPIGDDYERYGYERFLGLPPERMAGVNTILRPNDRIAFGRLAAAKRLGIQGSGPSAQLRIASHDGQRFGAFASPFLTTSAQDIRAIGDGRSQRPGRPRARWGNPQGRHPSGRHADISRLCLEANAYEFAAAVLG